MGRFTLYRLALGIILASGAVHAKTLEVGIGTRYTRFDYAEELTPPAKSTESATFPTAVALARLYTAPRTYFQALYETVDNVSSTYNGSNLYTGAPVVSTDAIGFTTTEFSLYLELGAGLSVYGGYGQRKWNRFLSGNPGYREIYSWNYTPIGAQLWLFRNGPVDLGFDGSMRPTKNGKIQVITSQTISGGQDSVMDLGARTGYRLAVPAIWHFGGLSVSTTPFFELSQIGESKVVLNRTLAPNPGTGIMEPSSHTFQFGLEVLLTLLL